MSQEYKFQLGKLALSSARQIQQPLIQGFFFSIALSMIASPAWSLPSASSSWATDRVDHEGQQNEVSQPLLHRVGDSNVSGKVTSDKVVDSRVMKADTTSPSASPPSPSSPPPPPTPSIPPLDIEPQTVQDSPVLQRWLQKAPNVLDDIRRDPSFRSRLRLGYSQFPSTNQASGVMVGLEDVFVGRSGLTVSADYQTAFNGKRESWGADLRYYILPLGSYINVAPVLGYRRLETTRYSTDGVNVGVRLLLVPSRTGAADISLTQTWVAPTTDEEVGLTTLSFGYAITRHLRLSTDIQKQNSRQRQDSRVGIALEWMF